jgi:hypothetical protein
MAVTFPTTVPAAMNGAADHAPRDWRTTARRLVAGAREASQNLSLKLHVEIGIRAAYASQRPRLIGQNCTIVATDVVSFGASARTDEDRLIIRAATAAMTAAAFKTVWPACGLQDTGDGLVVVIPPDTTTATVVGNLLTALPAALELHNASQRLSARVQLRVAIDVGPVFDDATGFSGDAIIATTRMLDAPPFKYAVAAEAPALGLITSSFVFDTAVRNGGLVGDEPWTRVEATVKERQLTAWYHLVQPGALTECEAGSPHRLRLAGRPGPQRGQQLAPPRVPSPRRQQTG